ncbi:MAG: adenosylcobinamide-GDP ribazoletransferase, partial [Anaerovorax sp.]
MNYKTAFFMAWGNFLSIPCPSKKWNPEERDLMLVFLPVIGLVIGVLWCLIWVLLKKLGISFYIDAAILTLYPFVVSGLMHLDGFMDCCDAILSRKPLAERQRILKDSSVGAFSVVSVLMLFMMLYSAMCARLQSDSSGFMAVPWDFMVLLWIPAVTRALSARAVLIKKSIGHSQYQDLPKGKKKKYGRVCLAMAVFVQVIPLLIILKNPSDLFGTGKWLLLQNFLLIFVVVNVVHYVALKFCTKQLGGMSGDISGFAITV